MVSSILDHSWKLLPKDMPFNVLNSGKDSHTGTNHTLGVNAITAEVDSMKYKLPLPVPNKIELEYAESIGVRINSPLLQYVFRTTRLDAIRNPTSIGGIISDYSNLLQRYPESLGDFYLQIPQRNNLQLADLDRLHNIQNLAGAKIISSYEPNREQTATDFEAQIVALRQQFPKKIVSPTLDMGIQTEDLFAEKLKIAVDGKKFKRINVIYRSIPENISNWIDLTQGIYKKDVWINVVGITPRWHRTSMVSTVSTVFLFGVHTVSMGIAWRGTPQARSFIFNPVTHRFNLAANRISYPTSRRESFEGLSNEGIEARRHIIKGTYFSDYVPARQGLQHTLNTIA